jgi:hypothetical protein
VEHFVCLYRDAMRLDGGLLFGMERGRCDGVGSGEVYLTCDGRERDPRCLERDGQGLRWVETVFYLRVHATKSRMRRWRVGAPRERGGIVVSSWDDLF